MSDLIEESKSNRATCRTCKKKIDKGILRFGEEGANAFDPEGGPAIFWHHLECAAGRVPAKVKAAMASFVGVIPEKEKIEAILAAPPKAASRGGAAKASYPYAERASTGRSKCMQCDEAVAKDTFRIAVEREVDTGSFTTTGPGYLHPACAAEYTEDDDLLSKIKANTPSLTDDDVSALGAEL